MRAAFQKAIRFGKDKIHLFPWDGYTWLQAVSRDVGLLQRLPFLDLPPVVLDAKRLGQLFKSIKKLEPADIRVEEGFISFGQGASLPSIGNDFAGHPLFPEAYTTFGGYDLIASLTYAAGAAERSVIRSTGQWVEAFDPMQYARLELDPGWVGCVPTDLFRLWDADTVGVAATKDHLMLKLSDDEYRYTGWVQPNLLPTEKITAIADKAALIAVIVGRDALISALGLAISVSEQHLAVIQFRPGRGVSVVAWVDNNEAAFAHTIPTAAEAYDPSTASGTLIVNAQTLERALRKTTTENVVLRYSGDLDFLRVEAGLLMAGISVCLPDGGGARDRG